MNEKEIPLNVFIASDHAGYALKEALKLFLKNSGISFTDMGAFSEESVNWAEFGAKAAARVSADPKNSRGIIICGSGIGMSMVSNKFKHVRAALCHDPYAAEMSRRHNNANVLNLGARVISADLAENIVRIWLETPFDGGRHQERLNFLAQNVEEKNFK